MRATVYISEMIIGMDVNLESDAEEVTYIDELRSAEEAFEDVVSIVGVQVEHEGGEILGRELAATLFERGKKSEMRW